MVMERQKSFSFKPTRFLVFSLAVSSSVIFFIFFFIWIAKSTPSIPQDTSLGFNKTSSELERSYPVNAVQNLTLKPTLFREPVNTTGVLEISVSKELRKEKAEAQAPVAGGDEVGKSDANSTVIPDKSAPFEQSEVPSNERTEEKDSKAASVDKIEVQNNNQIHNNLIRECDFTKGRWVYDESYPLYRNSTCAFIDEAFDCEGNGRLDKDYMKRRWQPQDCDIPRFNATRMLELIRGKRLVFVGDSINRNQWESMLCMLLQGVRDPKRVHETHGRRITKEKGNYSFKFLDYKCTVEYYVTHFLVHESKARIGKKRRPTLRIDAMDRGSSRWKGADILVFNTAHWWTHHKTQAGINYYQERDEVHPQLDVSTAFRIALTTWASWVDKHINSQKTQVFFRSSAPSHFRGGEWNSGGHCREARQPLKNISSKSYPEKNRIVEEVIKQMRTPVTFLNVTVLSEYRIDGHPSTYGRKPGKVFSSSGQDCSHWCLPGTPDTWNQLLYFYLQSKRGNKFR